MLNVTWSRVTECKGKVTWAVGISRNRIWGGSAKSWGEAVRNVGRLMQRPEIAAYRCVETDRGRPVTENEVREIQERRARWGGRDE